MEILENNIFYKGLDRIVYWSKFFAISMIILGVLMGLVAIFSLFGISDLDGINQMPGTSVGFFIFFVYGIGAAFYIVPAVWLLNFSNKTRIGINKKDESEFAEGFRNFGRYYTFWGISLVVFLSFNVFGILILILKSLANM